MKFYDLDLYEMGLNDTYDYNRCMNVAGEID